MVASKRKLLIAAACYIGVIACGVWGAPSFDAKGNAAPAPPSAASGPAVEAAAPAYLDATPYAFIAGSDRGNLGSSAHRRVLERIAAARNKWVPMTAIPHYAPMTPIPSGPAMLRGRPAMAPESDVDAAFADTANAY